MLHDLRSRHPGATLKTYVFPVALTEDDDGRWSATCPSLPGCATWGATREIALQFIHEAAQAYVADLLDAGQPLPPNATVLDEPAVAVTV